VSRVPHANIDSLSTRRYFYEVTRFYGTSHDEMFLPEDTGRLQGLRHYTIFLYSLSLSLSPLAIR